MAYEKYRDKEGNIVPRCTSIIGDNLGWNKNALVAWARREALKGNDPTLLKDKAALIGTCVHDRIEHHIYGQMWGGYVGKYADITDADIITVEASFSDYKAWEVAHNVKYLESELKVVSERLKWGGTIDTIAEVDGEVCLVDFKTSNNVYEDHIIQVSAYYDATVEVTQYRPTKVLICHIRKDDCLDGEPRVNHHYVSQEALDRGIVLFELLRRIDSMKKSLKTWEATCADQ